MLVIYLVISQRPTIAASVGPVNLSKPGSIQLIAELLVKAGLQNRLAIARHANRPLCYASNFKYAFCHKRPFVCQSLIHHSQKQFLPLLYSLLNTVLLFREWGTRSTEEASEADLLI